MTGINPDFADENSDAAAYIEQVLIPQWLEQFKKKNKDYQGSPLFMLGLKGQFSDINRKFWKLKKAMWDEAELECEQIEEILDDFIGHAMLTKFLLHREGEDG